MIFRDEATVAAGDDDDEDNTDLCQPCLMVSRSAAPGEARTRLAAQFDLINTILAEQGLPEHEEVQGGLSAEALRTRHPVRALPSSWLDRLKSLQAATLVDGGRDIKTAPALRAFMARADRDELIAAAHGAGHRTHLLCHSAGGFFVPVDFGATPPPYDRLGRMPGGWLGSSVQLLDELLALSPLLDISLEHLKGGLVRRGGGFDVGAKAVEELQQLGQGPMAVAGKPLWPRSASTRRARPTAGAKRATRR